MSHRAHNTQNLEIQEKRGSAIPTKQKLSPLIALIDNPAEDFKSRYRNIKTSTAPAPPWVVSLSDFHLPYVEH